VEPCFALHGTVVNFSVELAKSVNITRKSFSEYLNEKYFFYGWSMDGFEAEGQCVMADSM
jgi:hypothetical protein